MAVMFCGKKLKENDNLLNNFKDLLKKSQFLNIKLVKTQEKPHYISLFWFFYTFTKKGYSVNLILSYINILYTLTSSLSLLH